ncbi:MAG: hypothetical protein WAO52_15105 [Prolixibacteraceae bacterium]
MEEILHNQVSWITFLIISFLLLIILQVANFGVRYLYNFMLFGRIRIPVADLAKKGLVILEPIIFICILGLFVSIHPLINGMAVLLFCAVTFIQIRDYLSGRIILYTSTIMNDKKISTGKFSGSVVKIGKMGMHISTPEGVLYLNHYRIITEGFTLSAGEELGEYCQITISKKSGETKTQDVMKRLNEILVTLPFVNWKYKPKITTSHQVAGEIEIKMLLHEKVTSEEVFRFFVEAGYQCVIRKS